MNLALIILYLHGSGCFAVVVPFSIFLGLLLRAGALTYSGCRPASADANCSYYVYHFTVHSRLFSDVRGTTKLVLLRNFPIVRHRCCNFVPGCSGGN